MCMQSISFTEVDRRSLAILMISLEHEDISVYHLQDALKVSRGTILSDIKKIQRYAIEMGICLKYSRQYGYRFYGDEQVIRLLIHKSVLILIAKEAYSRSVEQLLDSASKTLYKTMRLDVKNFLKRHRLNVVPSRLEEIIYFLSFAVIRSKKHPVLLTERQSTITNSLMINKKISELVNHFPDIKDKNVEANYFTLVLMGIIQSSIREKGTEFLYQCAYGICQKFEHQSSMTFKNFDDVVEHVYVHLVPTYFRIIGKFSLENQIIEQIQRQYKHLFQLTQYF